MKTTKNKKFYYVFIGICLLLCGYGLAKTIPAAISPKNLYFNDFDAYWLTGRMNITGQNPYSYEDLYKARVELTGGTYKATALFYPPYSITIFMPFALLNFQVALILWLFTNIIILMACANQIWNLYKGDKKWRWVSWLIVFVSMPAILIAWAGQSSGLLLLGIVGFLVSINKHKDYQAGAFFVLALIKPQIMLLFGIFLLVWMVQERRWKVLVSSIATAALLTIVAAIPNPKIFSQFIDSISLVVNPVGQITVMDWYTPTIGAWLRRFVFGWDKKWLQYIPTLFGIIWAIYYWMKRKANWDWLEATPLIIFMTFITASYAWLHDEILLMIPVLQVVAEIINSNLLLSKRKWPGIWMLGSYIAITVFVIIASLKIDEFWFVWLAPVLLVWYFYIRGFLKKSGEQELKRNELLEVINL